MGEFVKAKEKKRDEIGLVHVNYMTIIACDNIFYGFAFEEKSLLLSHAPSASLSCSDHHTPETSDVYTNATHKVGDEGEKKMKRKSIVIVKAFHESDELS